MRVILIDKIAFESRIVRFRLPAHCLPNMYPPCFSRLLMVSRDAWTSREAICSHWRWSGWWQRYTRHCWFESSKLRPDGLSVWWGEKNPIWVGNESKISQYYLGNGIFKPGTILFTCMSRSNRNCTRCDNERYVPVSWLVAILHDVAVGQRVNTFWYFTPNFVSTPNSQSLTILKIAVPASFNSQCKIVFR